MATGADTLIILALSSAFIVAGAGLLVAGIVTAAIGTRRVRVAAVQSNEEVVSPLLQLVES